MLGRSQTDEWDATGLQQDERRNARKRSATPSANSLHKPFPLRRPPSLISINIVLIITIIIIIVSKVFLVLLCRSEGSICFSCLFVVRGVNREPQRPVPFWFQLKKSLLPAPILIGLARPKGTFQVAVSIPGRRQLWKSPLNPRVGGSTRVPINTFLSWSFYH